MKVPPSLMVGGPSLLKVLGSPITDGGAFLAGGAEVVPQPASSVCEGGVPHH